MLNTKTFSKLFTAALLITCMNACDNKAPKSVDAKEILNNTAFSGVLDIYDLGSWAMLKHNEISWLIYPAIKEGELTTIGLPDKKPLDKAVVLKEFETKYVAFISTDEYDPRIGYDTTIIGIQNEHYYQFIISDTEVIIRVNENGNDLAFDKNEFYKLLNDDQKLYLATFAVGNKLAFKSIPTKAFEIIMNMNTKLHTESIDAKTELYTNDSMVSIFDLETKQKRGNIEYPAFVSTDANNPTIGHDTIVVEPLNIHFKDTSKNQSLHFVFAGDPNNLSLYGISCGYAFYLGGVQFANSFAFGYIKYSNVKSLVKTEKQLLEKCIFHSIKNNLNKRVGDIDYYIEYFKLISKRS